MFKALNIYRAANLPSIGDMEAALDAARFTPCSATQAESIGWVEPRGQAHGAMVESIAGQRIMKLVIETKSVPGAAVKRKAQGAADHIEAATGRKPGKKEMKALREDALLELLPHAFPKQAAVWVWFDPATGIVVHDASSSAKSDTVVSALVRTFNQLSLSLVITQQVPIAAMAKWLVDPDSVPENFTIGRECDLKSHDEEKALVRFKNHHLHTAEVNKHINEGKMPEKLAVCYDDRLTFILTDRMFVKKLTLLDKLLDERDPDQDAFDADVAIITGELRRFIPALIDALGGEPDLFGGAA